MDERDESLREKHALMEAGAPGQDPYEPIMALIRREVDPSLWEEKGTLDVPEWLCPVPPAAAGGDILVEKFVSFIDQDGCRAYADRVGDLVAEIFPHIPCMIAIDHSLSGGAFKRLAELYSPDDLSFVVLDSHTDAMPMSVLSGAIGYDMETNPNSPYDPEDPFIFNRPESYNASSFLYHLLEEGVVEPENLYVLGISDYPPKRSFRIKDRRIRRYVGLYSALKRQGVKLITKKDILTSPSRLRTLLNRIGTPYMYVSIDLDIGSRNALEGVRFRDRHGLSERQIYTLVGYLEECLSQGVGLAGLDLNEINPRTVSSGPDRTYRIAANLIRKLGFYLPEVE